MTLPASGRLPIQGGWQLTVRMSQAGQEAVCVLGYLGTAENNDPSQVEAQDLLQDAWNALRLCATETTTCLGGTLRSVGGFPVVVKELAAPTSVTGAVTGIPQVAAAASLIKWSTANGTRSGKGRTFIPGMPSAFMNNDQRTYSSAGTNAIQAAADGLISPAAGGPGWVLAVLSFKNGAAYPVTSGAPSRVIGVQRKRMRG